MMRLVLTLLTFAVLLAPPAFAESTRIVLDYDFGNQVSRSSLTVLSSGLIMKSETNQGITKYLEDEKLGPNELIDLFLLVFEAAETQPVRNDQIPAAFGSAFGEAKAFGSDGSQFYLYALLGGENGNKTLLCQENYAANKLRAFIDSRVRDRMPLKNVPCK